MIPQAEAEPGTAVPASAAVEKTIEKRDDERHALAALEKLPERQQEVIRLKFQGGLSYREISRVTGLSESNVGYLIHTGLKAVREELAGRRKP